MAVKILAVDDSAVMRKIMEMTFAGENAEVVTVASGEEAVERAKSMNPDVVLADASMSGMDGYAVAQAIKSQSGSNAAVIVLASQHNPYDEGKGKSNGVDDHVAKPFDSQVVIDKVAQVLARPRAAGSASAAEAPAAMPSNAPRAAKRTMAFGSPPVGGVRPPAPPSAPERSATARLPAAKPPSRPVLELADDDEPEISIEAPASEAPRKSFSRPAPAAAQPSAAQPSAAQPSAAQPSAAQPSASPSPAASSPTPSGAAHATRSGGDMAAKLEGLGLDKTQIEGVLALSREVIEQVVWEVVPDLAEVLIREEIARLTAE